MGVWRHAIPTTISTPDEAVRCAERALDTAAESLDAVKTALQGVLDADERLRPAAEQLRDARREHSRALHRWLNHKVRNEVKSVVDKGHSET